MPRLIPGIFTGFTHLIFKANSEVGEQGIKYGVSVSGGGGIARGGSEVSQCTNAEYLFHVQQPRLTTEENRRILKGDP